MTRAAVVEPRERLDPTPGLAPDASIPGRDALLDPAALALHLGDLLGLDGVVGAEIRRAKYRLGESLRVVVELTTTSGPVVVSARTFAADTVDHAHERALAAAAQAPAPSPGSAADRPGVVLDRTHHAVWWVLPNDRRIEDLASVLHPSGATTPAGWSASTLMEYSPERSATVRATDRSGRILGYVKAYAPGAVDVELLARRYEHVAAALGPVADVRSPRVVAVDPVRHRLVLEPMAGRQWGDLDGDEIGPALGRLGAAIAHLHGVDTAGAAGIGSFGRLRSARLVNSAALVARARPDVGARIVAVADHLEQVRPAPGSPCFLHGDCHPKNALVADGALSLIDLDQAGIGPAAADLGSLLARLRFGTIVGERPGTDEDALARAFLDGYAGVAPLPTEADLRWHTAAALVAERAIRAVNRVQRHALTHLDRIVAAAEDTASGARPSPTIVGDPR